MSAPTALASCHPSPLRPTEFNRIRKLLKERTGIHLSDIKLPLVESRLSKRLVALSMSSYKDYLSLVDESAAEAQTAINLLTTNETFFFREPKHFEHLSAFAKEHMKFINAPRIWCAACSTGEEAYTVSMVLADALAGKRYEVLASDISTRVLGIANAAIYPVEDAADIPKPYRLNHCMKGVDEQAGRFTVSSAIRRSVEFAQINLNEALPGIGPFDIVFLRNVMIYFDQPTKEGVVQRVCELIKPGGLLYISHTESLHGIKAPLKMIRPSIYERAQV